MTGPIVVVGRPRSGTRVLARVMRDSGLFMGVAVTADFLDSTAWWMRFVAPLMASRWFPRWPDLDDDAAFARFCTTRLADTLSGFFGPQPREGAWGWKFPETLFVMPVLARLLPGVRFVHIVRDGRDVCLSQRGFFQLTGAHADPSGWAVPPLDDACRPGADPTAAPTFREFCLAVTFGDPAIRRWNGIDLDDREQLVANRFLIQMQSWRHCVEVARASGALLGDGYLEVRYDALCRRPVETVARLLERLGLPLRPSVAAYLASSVHPRRVAAWRTARLTRNEARDFERAVLLGAPLLAELDAAPA